LTWLIVNWCFRNRKCFTCQFRSQYRRTRREVFPVLSRIQNIGYEMGENDRTAEWYRANHWTPWVAGCVKPHDAWTLAGLSLHRFRSNSRQKDATLDSLRVSFA